MLTKQRRRRSSRASGSDLDEADLEAENDNTQETLLPVAPQPGLWWYLAVPIVGILLCGSKEPWALGILALLVGGTAIFATPRKKASAWLTVPVLLGLALCLLAFLPLSWFSVPEWRATLLRDFGITMGSTRSPQPGVTFESWLALATGAVWLVCCVTRGFASSERRIAIRVLAIFVCLIACAAMVVRWQKFEIPFWRGPWDIFYFGPFPNRNLLSELLAVGAVLLFASAYDAFRRKQTLWIALVPAIIPIFAAMLLNTSRMGVIVFFGGLGAWMFTATFQKRSAHRVAVAAAILLLLAAAFLIFGRQIIDRFTTQNLASDSRLRMFGDALRVISQAPVLGIGLGNFEPVFAITRPEGELYSRALHPENDWLWFGAETGIPCLLLALAAGGALVLRFGPWRTHDTNGRRDRRVRNAAGIGALLLCLAGMVDPVLHAPGLFTLAALLAGVALRPTSASELPAARPALLLRKGAGLFCVGAGVVWFFIDAGHPVIRGNSVYRQLYAEAVSLSARGDDAAALEKWNEAAAIKPLQWNAYFERARVKLRLGRTSREALEDFGRARQLEPHNADKICLHEFVIWLDHDPVSGIPALREAFKRDPSRAVEFFQNNVGRVEKYPELRPHFRSMAETNPKFLLAYLCFAATTAEFPVLLDHLLVAQPTLEIFTSEERLRLFKAWNDRGDVARLISQLERNADWRHDGWSVLAAHKAKEGDFRAAYEVALSNVPPPPRENVPQAELSDLVRAFNASPTDFKRGFQVYEAQRRQGRFEDALDTLDQLSKLPRAPSRIIYERGVTLAAKGDHAKAWEALREYQQQAALEKKRT